MVTTFPDFGSALDDWLEGTLKLARCYEGHRWRDIHPIVHNSGSERALLGLASGDWLESPTKAFLAELADVTEKRGDPSFLRGAASGVQRIACFDPVFKERFLELATHVDDLGRFDDGCSGVALEAHAQLEELLAARLDSWSRIEEVLGEAHPLVLGLIILAWRRLAREPDNWHKILTVIARLRWQYRIQVLSNPDFSAEDRRSLIQLHTSMERFMLRDWVRSSGSEDVVSLLRHFEVEDFGNYGRWR